MAEQYAVQLLLVIICLMVRMARAEINSPSISPISFGPTSSWDGNDGPWNTFAVQIGTPPQDVRVLISSSGSSLWTVLAEGCLPQDPPNCRDLRGTTFNTSLSTSWDYQGLFQVPLAPESALPYHGNSEVGIENITLGWQGSGGPTINDQIVIGIVDNNTYMGVLGLSSTPVNISNYNHPHQSVLAALKNNSMIPSLSWAYTAGIYNRALKGFASLTFGGYDSSLAGSQNLTFQFGLGVDISRDLLVNLKSIQTAGQSLLADPIYAFVDSFVPYIWLPVSSCKRFEGEFGLVWDSVKELYLVNDSLHDSLVARNPNITFTLSNQEGNGGNSANETIDIVLSYASFDLIANYPLLGADYNKTSRYFPLKRAANDTQYTIGRTFLQESYLVVDYERSTFALSQVQFPSSETKSHIVAIYAPNGNSSSTPKPTHQGLTGGAIAGIVIGVVALLIAVLAGYYLIRRHKRETTSLAAEKAARNAEDMYATMSNKGESGRAELDAGAATARGAAGRSYGRGELDATGTERELAELDSREPRAIQELPTTQREVTEENSRNGTSPSTARNPLTPDGGEEGIVSPL